MVNTLEVIDRKEVYAFYYQLVLSEKFLNIVLQNNKDYNELINNDDDWWMKEMT